MKKIHSYQNAVPSLRELLPVIIGFPMAFLTGFAGIVAGTNHYFAPPISQAIFWIGLVVCLIFGGLILWFFKMWKLANELDRRGLVTQGTIIDVWEDNARYYIRYAFDLKHFGQETGELAANQTVKHSLYTQLQKGSTVRVRFLTDDPKVSRMETNPWKWEY
jgi:hypothetical protein